MSAGAGMAMGWTQRGDENRRSRLELMKAFNEFRRLNPHAGADELQQFIDQSYGGENYLYGAPSGDLIQKIGQENLRRKQQDEERQALADMATQADTQRKILELGSQYVTQLGDPVAAYNALVGNFGGKRDVVDKIIGGVGGMEGIKIRAQAESVGKHRDMALNILRNNGGKVQKGQFAALGIHPTIEDAIWQDAEGVFKKERMGEFRTIRQQEEARIDKMIEGGAGSYQPDDYVPEDLRGPLDQYFKERRDAYTTKRKQERGVIYEARSTKLAADAATTNMIINGASREDVARYVTAQLREGMGGFDEPTPQEIDAAVSQAYRQAQSAQTTSAQKKLGEADVAAAKAETSLWEKEKASLETITAHKALKNRPVLKSAVEQIAEAYRLSPQAAQVLQEKIINGDFDDVQNDPVNAARKILSDPEIKAGVMTREQFGSKLKTEFRKSLGANPPQSFNGYLSEEVKSAETAAKTFSQVADAGIASKSPDTLKRVIAAAEGAKKAALSGIAKGNANLLAGEDWNDVAARQTAEQIVAQFDAVIARAAGELEKIVAAQPKPPGAPAPAGNPTFDKPFAERPVGKVWNWLTGPGAQAAPTPGAGGP